MGYESSGQERVKEERIIRRLYCILGMKFRKGESSDLFETVCTYVY